MIRSRHISTCLAAIVAGMLTYQLLGAPRLRLPRKFSKAFNKHEYSQRKQLLKPALDTLPPFTKVSFFQSGPEVIDMWMSLHYLFAPMEFVRNMNEQIALGRYEGDVEAFAKSHGYHVKKSIGQSWYLLEKDS